ncbi:Uncharacterised protein [uncultured archaeon]|nr:Uncharacterised protein [uncultured archaeon]
MRMIFLAFALLALLPLHFADFYTSFYTDGWAKVTRSIYVSEPYCSGGVTGVCADTGAPTGPTAYSTQVNLTVENTGPVERRQVELTESLQQVPDGARIAFDPRPASSSGDSATFSIADIPAGGKRTVGYSFAARMTESQAAGIGQPKVSSAAPEIQLFAPSSSKVGDRVSLALMTLSGSPVPSTLVTVSYPDGSSQDMRTDYRGRVSFTAEKEGFYTYDARGYSLAKVVSTEVKLAQEQPPPATAGAVLVDQGIASSLLGLLPILGAIIGIAAIMLIIYNFFASREEEGQAQPPQEKEPEQYYYAPAQQPETPAYTQKISFAEAKEDMQDATRNLVESRKRQMASEQQGKPEPIRASAPSREAAEAAPAEQQHAGHEPHEKQPQPQYWQEVAQDEEDELEGEIGRLEEQARTEGEITEQEDEIEQAIAELEEIRLKLRERRDQSLGVEQEVAGEASAAAQAPPRKPQPRVLPPSERVEPTATPFVKKK